MITKSPFAPARGLSNRHLQTLLASLPFVRPRPTLKLRRETVELPDGDFIDVDWTGGRGPIVLVLHGLEGSVRSRYAAAIMHACRSAGLRAALLHFRGCSGKPNRLARSYHAGDTGDLRYYLSVLADREPGTPVAAVGYSLGGNVLLKHLGETGRDSGLATAVAVSVPFDLDNACRAITTGFSRLYEWVLIRRMRNTLRTKFEDAMPARLEPALESRGFYEFDDLVTAPLNGFTGAAEYYAKSSSRQFLEAIETPTLILHALDDPFMTPAAVPTDAELSAAVTLELSETGGHVGFLAGGRGFKPWPWLDERIVSHLAQYLPTTQYEPETARDDLPATT